MPGIETLSCKGRIWNFAGTLLLALVLASLSACGGGGGSSASTSTASTVGTAGGTVTGPDGVQLDIPAGALDSDVTITIARSSSGAPALPADAPANAPVYEITPHGLRFDQPVTIRFPTTTTPGADDAVLVAEDGGPWQSAATTVGSGYIAIQRNSLSWYTSTGFWQDTCLRDSNDPYTCVRPTVRPEGDITVTPTSAWATPHGLWPVLTDAADVTWPMRITAPRDCGGGTLTVKQRVVPPGTPVTQFIPYQQVSQQSVAISAMPNDTKRSSALVSHTAHVAAGENHAVHLVFTFTCQRAYNGNTYRAYLEAGYVATVPTSSVPLVITQDPVDTTVVEGSTATFSVTATGNAPLTYQWYRDGQAINGATAATYSLANAQLADSGAQFYVEVSDSAANLGTSAIATLTVTAAPTPGNWSCGASQLIESGSGNAAEPRVVLDANGNATAVWSQDDGTKWSVFGNRYSAGTGWGTEQVIDHTLANAAYAMASADASGDIQVVWQGGSGVYANHYTAGGWGSGTDWYDGTGTNPASSPAVAVNSGGQAVAVWQKYDGLADSIYARYFTSGSWGATQTIDSDAAHPASTPDVAIDGTGNVLSVWRQSNGTSYGAYYNVFNGTEWGTAQAIPGSTNVQLVRVAMNASGQAVAIWVQNDGSNYGLYAAAYAAGSGWGTTATLDAGTTQGINPYVGIDASGNAIAVWEQWDGVGHRIYARRYAGGSWSAIAQLQCSTGCGDAWEPAISMDSSGNALVTWMQWQSTTFGIFGNRYLAGSGWEGPVLLSDSTGDVATPRVALNGNGEAMVVWREGDGSGSNISIRAVHCQ